MKNRIAVETRNLTTGYPTRKGERIVTANINEVLYSGELTCLLGPNGAGKSTILKTLSAFIPPLKGEIFLDERPLSTFTDKEMAKQIGVVLTERLSVSNMTVREMVGMGRSPYTGMFGGLSNEDREIVKSAIELTGIQDLIERNVSTLSDGERQKVMIAKALAQQTPVIFLDEPTAFLDYPSKVEMLRLLRGLAKNRNKTIFLSTHDLEIALRITDRVWLMDKKLGLVTGTPDELSEDGSISRYFDREGVRYDPASKTFLIN